MMSLPAEELVVDEEDSMPQVELVEYVLVESYDDTDQITNRKKKSRTHYDSVAVSGNAEMPLCDLLRSKEGAFQPPSFIHPMVKRQGSTLTRDVLNAAKLQGGSSRSVIDTLNGLAPKEPNILMLTTPKNTTGLLMPEYYDTCSNNSGMTRTRRGVQQNRSFHFTMTGNGQY